MVSSITPNASDVIGQDLISLSDFVVLASYNWLDEPEPTILVPGVPAIWSPPADTPALKPDTGTRYIDQNADRMPNAPFEPLIRAIQTHRPEFDFSKVDIVTDRRSLRQLYAFINGDGKSFEFGVEAVGNTVVFTRTEPRTRETIAPGKFAGYRQSFEKAYTRLHSSAKGSTAHHRIVSYTFGGLRLLVRSGKHAYRPLPDGADSSQEDFVENIKTLSLDKGILSTATASATRELQIVTGGFDVPQSNVLEVSTHAAAKPSIIEAKLIDLYLAQTTCFVEATFRSSGPWHDLSAQRGRFEDISINDVTHRTREWERDHQNELRKLVDVLQQMISETRILGSPCMAKYTGQGPLELEAVGDGEVPNLPEKLRELFGNNGQ